MRAGSTLAASSQLGMAQPTVARRIETLEHDLDITLFERNTRGFRPTEAARAILQKAEEIEVAVICLAETVETLRSARPIRITAYSGNFSPRVATIFNEFSLIRPDVSFEFLPNVEVLDLSAGDADIALRTTRSPPHPDLICRKISTARYALFGSHAYVEKHGLPNSVEDLFNHKFVSFLREGVPSALHDWLMRYAEPDQIRQTYSELDLMHAAIRSGHGLGIINVKLAESDNTLIQCFAPLEGLDSEHLMLIAPEAYRRPEVKAFSKFFAPRYAAIFK